MFNTLLIATVVFLTVVIIAGYLNEKTIQLPNEIALLFAGLIISIAAIILYRVFGIAEPRDSMPKYLLDEFLVKGVLCFMLFSGACELKFKDLKTQFRLISCLSLVTTILSAFFYGGLVYLAATLLHLPVHFENALLLGCIVAPTDPIAAMSILRKVGLPEDIALTIEGESLFNDGVGVALFVVVSNTIKSAGESGNVALNFLGLLSKELFGAIVIGFVISFLLYQIFLRTKDEFRQIMVSLLAVSASYVVCEYVGCSPAIASVICGIFFATYMDKPEQEDPSRFYTYRHFWATVDALLNSILYVMLGLTFMNVFRYTDNNMIWIVIAVVACIVARYAGVLVSVLAIKKKPQNYKVIPFTNLLTWAGLRGALCLALAMDTHYFVKPDTFQTILVCTFAVVMFTTVLQGLTIGKFYKLQTKRNQE